MAKRTAQDYAREYHVNGWVRWGYFTEQVTLALSAHYGYPKHRNGEFGWDVSEDVCAEKSATTVA